MTFPLININVNTARLWSSGCLSLHAFDISYEDIRSQRNVLLLHVILFPLCSFSLSLFSPSLLLGWHDNWWNRPSLFTKKQSDPMPISSAPAVASQNQSLPPQTMWYVTVHLTGIHPPSRRTIGLRLGIPPLSIIAAQFRNQNHEQWWSASVVMRSLGIFFFSLAFFVWF